MSQSISQATRTFRQRFVLNSKIRNWFPGHMQKGMRQINKKLHRYDCIIEIHDARVPFTGRNSEFHRQLAQLRPHILVLNKVDLCDRSLCDAVVEKITKKEQIQKVIYSDLRTRLHLSHGFLPEILKIIRQSERFQRTDRGEINLMVTGIPNVGKSTFINQISNLYTPNKGVVARKGGLPGVTRAIQERIKVSSNPLIYILDTPGILEPKFEDPVEDPLKLAACGLLPTEVIGNEIVADYILYWLNKHDHFDYAEKLGIDGPVDQIDEFLAKFSIKNDFFIKKYDPGTKTMVRRANFELAAKTFIKMFQRCELGHFVLDVDQVRDNRPAYPWLTN